MFFKIKQQVGPQTNSNYHQSCIYYGQVGIQCKSCVGTLQFLSIFRASLITSEGFGELLSSIFFVFGGQYEKNVFQDPPTVHT